MRVRPERFVAGGEALARDDDGRVVFVRGGVPGDDVSVEITEKHGDWSRGRVDRRSTSRRPIASSRRARSGATVAAGATGSTSHVDAQLPAKVAIVVDAMRRTGQAARRRRACERRRCRRSATARRSGWSATPTVGRRSGMERSNGDRSGRRMPGRSPVPGGVARRPRRATRPRGHVAGVGGDRRGDRAVGRRRWATSAGFRPHVAVGPDAAAVRTASPGITSGSRRDRSSRAVRLRPSCSSTAVRAIAPELAGAGRVLDAYAGVGLFAVAATDPDSELVAVESSRSAVADCPVEPAVSASPGRAPRGRAVAPAARASRSTSSSPIRRGPGWASPAWRRWRRPRHRCSCWSAATRWLWPATRRCCDARVSARRHRRARPVSRDAPRRGRHAGSCWQTDTVIHPVLSDDVARAVADGRPVVALESTIFSNLGLPSPANAQALDRCLTCDP